MVNVGQLRGGSGTVRQYRITVPRDLLEALAEHYADDDDMLRQAARDVVDGDD